MTPADRKALHTILDGLINAGAEVFVHAAFYPSPPPLEGNLAAALAALDEYARSTQDHLVLYGYGIDTERVTLHHFGDLLRPELSPEAFVEHLRAHSGYAPGKPVWPVRSSVGIHRRIPAKQEDAGI